LEEYISLFSPTVSHTVKQTRHHLTSISRNSPWSGGPYDQRYIWKKFVQHPRFRWICNLEGSIYASGNMILGILKKIKGAYMRKRKQWIDIPTKHMYIFTPRISDIQEKNV